MKPTLLVAVIGLALGGLVGYHTIYAPQQEQARLIAVKAAQRQADQQAQDDTATLLKQIEQYRKRLPPEPEPSWLVQEVVAVGRQLGIELTTIAPDVPQETPQYTRLSVTLQFDATYHELGAFLDAIERSDAFIRVEHFDLASQRDAARERGAGKASVQLVVSSFYVPSVLQAAASSEETPR